MTGTFQNPLWNVDFYKLKNKTQAEIAAPKYGAQFIRSEDSGSQLWWGSTHKSWQTTTALSANQKAAQSGYVFDGITPADAFSTTDSTFVFAKATHFNGEVWTNSATLASVDFKLDISGRITAPDSSGTKDFSLSAMFRLFHNETLNPAPVCALGGPQPCGDGVSIVGGIASSLPVVIGNMSYTFVLEGLVASLNGPVVTSFFTKEFEQNSAMFRARLDAQELPPPPPVVPLPAAVWMLLAGVGGLVAVARKRPSA
ncbi:VPLPA-CTERM sorting domain-containing protein [Palleronia sp. KMU-117]|uniref:VPLPA-CTERM sorting domain-containing protein n=1 Tax=Palleronia sp. KMU-117 TaxID=3434108 RepID=UPI003D71405A